MTGNTVELDEYRRLRGEKSRLMWRVLNRVFDRFSIPDTLRHQLMFMNAETYLSWSREEKIVSLEKLDLAVKYTQLYRALHAMCGDDDKAMYHWLFTANNGYPSLFQGRSPIDTILEDGQRVIEDITATLRTR
jgi:hypothetical protein